MSAEQKLPTVVLLNGSWHVPEHFTPLADKLREAGFTVRTPLFPTCDKSLQPHSTHEDNIAHIRTLLNRLCDENQHIILAVHSYGGVVGTDAMENLSLAHRQAQGLRGGVVALVYIAAFILLKGETPLHHFRPDFDSNDVAAFHEHGMVEITAPDELFYHDVDEDQRARAKELLVWHPLSTSSVVQAYEGWRDVPVTYVFCQNDKMIIPEWQREMLDNANAQGVDVKEVPLQSGHSPFLSQPEKLVSIIQQVVQQ